jgi:hypothetical protein
MSAAFATFQVNDKKVNLSARYTQKGSIVISTQKGDVVEFQPDGSVSHITTPFEQFTKN